MKMWRQARKWYCLVPACLLLKRFKPGKGSGSFMVPRKKNWPGVS